MAGPQQPTAFYRNIFEVLVTRLFKINEVSFNIFRGGLTDLSLSHNMYHNHFLSDFMMHHGAAGVVVVVDKNISNVTKIFYCLCGAGGVGGDTQLLNGAE